MKKILVSLLPLLLLINSIHAQGVSQKIATLFEEGQFFFNRGDYEDALQYFQKLVVNDSLNANYNFRVGESYLNIKGKEQLAIPYFKRAINNVVSKKEYKRLSVNERSAPLHVYFYLGNAYRINNQLDEALSSYSEFIDSPFFYGNYNQNIVDREIKSCERAKIIQDAPIDLEIVKLGTPVNTEFSEERPVISADGNSLVFIRRLKFYDAIFYSIKKGDKWSKAININPQIISDGDYYPTGLSSDGKELLLIRREAEELNIYHSIFDGVVWSPAKKMSGKINSTQNEVSASFGSNDASIFLASDRKGGRGGIDIWISYRTDDGSWAKPKNVGKQINTDADEVSPVFCVQDNILFFSSQAHYSMGGHDIFYSKKKEKGWTVPVNIGFPINNTGDNINYYPTGTDCRQGYYSIRHKGNNDLNHVYVKSENTLNYLESSGN